jgi:hypothetical protein
MLGNAASTTPAVSASAALPRRGYSAPRSSAWDRRPRAAIAPRCARSICSSRHSARHSVGGRPHPCTLAAPPFDPTSIVPSSRAPTAVRTRSAMLVPRAPTLDGDEPVTRPRAPRGRTRGVRGARRAGGPELLRAMAHTGLGRARGQARGIGQACDVTPSPRGHEDRLLARSHARPGRSSGEGSFRRDRRDRDRARPRRARRARANPHGAAARGPSAPTRESPLRVGALQRAIGSFPLTGELGPPEQSVRREGRDPLPRFVGNTALPS